MNDTDIDLGLLEAWRRGDEEAGTTLVQRHFDALYRFFAMRLDDGVADLVQRTFMAAVEARDRIPSDAVRRYLFGIAHKQLLMEIRRRSRQRDVPGSVEVVAASTGASPSHVVLRRQEQRLLVDALRRLPLDMQIALQLYYWEELGTAEIGEVLGIPAGTVKSRLFRARATLEEALAAAEAPPEVVSSTLTGLETWVRSVRAAFSLED